MYQVFSTLDQLPVAEEDSVPGDGLDTHNHLIQVSLGDPNDFGSVRITLSQSAFRRIIAKHEARIQGFGIGRAGAIEIARVSRHQPGSSREPSV
jgi:hypothetical protein